MASVWNMLGLTVVACSCIILQVSAISVRNCKGKDNNKIQIQSLTVSPTELKIPGDITVSGSVKLLTNITGPVKIEMTIKKKTAVGYVLMPCLHNIGSCTYKDACSLNPYAHSDTCPVEFNNLNIPCKCPLQKGVLAIDKYTYTVDSKMVPSFLVSGKYEIKVKLSSKEGDLGCFDAQITLH